MSVSVRKYEDGKTKGYEVDVVARCGWKGRSGAAYGWRRDEGRCCSLGTAAPHKLLLHRGTKTKGGAHVAEFETRFVQEFAVANRQKPAPSPARR